MYCYCILTLAVACFLWTWCFPPPTAARSTLEDLADKGVRVWNYRTQLVPGYRISLAAFVLLLRLFFHIGKKLFEKYPGYDR
jgi:hypothetical protein